MRARTGTTTLAAGVLSIAAGGAWGGAGCSPTSPTEIVPGALTQISVPQDMAGIKIEVLANGSRKFNRSYIAQDGVVFLPATLGITGTSDTTITVILGGYDTDGVNGQFFGDDSQDIGEVGTPGGPRIRRGSVQTYVDQHTLWLPMNLSYSCFDVDCSNQGAASTCKAASCVPSQMDSNKLVNFDPSLVDGTQDCFDPELCFPAQATVNAQPVDLSQCLFEVPPGSSAGHGLNVRLAYQDMQLVQNPATSSWEPQMVPTAEQEILNLESEVAEGFAIPDPKNPLQFKLAPGLCTLVQAHMNAPSMPPSTAKKGPYGYHTVGTVQVSTVCQGKAPLLPFCTKDQNPTSLTADGGKSSAARCSQPIPLVPAPSVAYMVMDGSSVMAAAFGAQGYATDTAAALGNPVFKNLSVAFEFMDPTPGDCTASPTPYTTPGKSPTSLEFQLAAQAQGSMTSLVGNPTFTDTVAAPYPLDLLAALRLDSGAYQHLNDYVAGLGDGGVSHVAYKTLMMFVNRVPAPAAADGGTGDGGAPDAGAGLFSGADCPLTGSATDSLSAVENAVAAAAATGISTYFFVLGDNLLEGNGVYGFYRQVQTDLVAKGVSGVQAIDATEMNQQSTVIGRIANAVLPFGTCLYEVPPGIDSSAQLHITVPVPAPPLTTVGPVSLTVPFSNQCNAMNAGAVNGWNFDGPHIRVCGVSGNSPLGCAAVRTAVGLLTSQTLGGDGGTSGSSTSVPDVSITATMPCVVH